MLIEKEDYLQKLKESVGGKIKSLFLKKRSLNNQTSKFRLSMRNKVINFFNFGQKNKVLTSTINNQFIVFEYLYDENWDEYGLNVAIPHNIVNPYEYEDKKNENIIVKDIKWRWFHTGLFKFDLNEAIGGFFDHTSSEIVFESMDSGGISYQTKKEVLNDIKNTKNSGRYKVVFYGIAKVGKVDIIVSYNDDDNIYERSIRCEQYKLSGIEKNQLFKSDIVFSAKNYVHDYTEYKISNSSFLHKIIKED